VVVAVGDVSLSADDHTVYIIWVSMVATHCWSDLIEVNVCVTKVC
jgi:hypothetical protein